MVPLTNLSRLAEPKASSKKYKNGGLMGAFRDHAERLHEFGIYTLPCDDKKPLVGKEWQTYCENLPDQSTIESWANKFPNAQQIGMILGKQSGFVAFDFDYEYNPKSCVISEAEQKKDYKLIEPQITALLPPTPCIKKGKKGWTRFYKYHESFGTRGNVSVKRNGVTLFDFLGWHKQTILPPSFHSENIHYRWLSLPIEEVLEDIPEITYDMVVRIANEFSETRQEENTRHLKVFNYIRNILAVEKDLNKVRQAAIAYDITVNDPPYLSDKKHNPSESAEFNADSFIRKIAKWQASRKRLKVAEPIEKQSWDYFFEHAFPRTRKDIISRQTFAKLNDGQPWFLMSSVEGVLRSYASQAGLNTSRTVDEFERWNLENPKLEFLCDLPTWDGVDRVAKFGNCFKSSIFTGDEITQILKQWGSNVFRRVKDATNQNRCIIFKGDQGLGKDSLLRSMLSEFNPYYETVALTGTTKDILEVASRILIGHIEEFDQTKGVDIAFLKSLITQPASFFRESYGAAPNQKIMRPSFISTANVDDILRDPTGNRRFIVVPIEGISWNYPQGESLQVMAQFKEHFERGEFVKIDPGIEVKIKTVLDEYTPEDLSVTILDLYRQRMTQLVGKNGAYPGMEYLTGPQFAELKLSMARLATCSSRKVEQCIKAAGFSVKFRDGMRYYVHIEAARRAKSSGHGATCEG